MTDNWNPDDLQVIGAANELTVAPTRADGSVGSYTTISVVRVGDDLYVRSYRGPAGGWYRAAQRSRQGRILAGAVERNVRFEQPPAGVGQSVDDAYRAKYGRSGYVEAMVTTQAAATTLRVVPR
jgi:hypothetical protein